MSLAATLRHLVPSGSSGHARSGRRTSDAGSALMAVAVLLCAACGGSNAAALSEVNVGYFEGWPSPNQFGQEDGSFAEAVGVDVNWIPLNTGVEMSDAMQAGEIDIAYSQGLTPFADAVNNGADLRMVGVAMSYSEADNCVASSDLGVTRDNAVEVLQDATVMTPIGNITHYKMLSMMEYLGVDLDAIQVVPTAGNDATADAFEAGDIDVGCAFGNAVERMLADGGTLIMTGAEHEDEIGIFTYDIVSIPAEFGEEHGATVTRFLTATETFNERWRADPAAMNPMIASAAGMEDVGSFLAGPTWFHFPTLDEQLADDWLGGGAAATMNDQLNTFVRLGVIDSIDVDFADFVDAGYLQAAVEADSALGGE